MVCKTTKKAADLGLETINLEVELERQEGVAAKQLQARDKNHREALAILTQQLNKANNCIASMKAAEYRIMRTALVSLRVHWLVSQPTFTILQAAVRIGSRRLAAERHHALCHRCILPHADFSPIKL